MASNRGESDNMQSNEARQADHQDGDAGQLSAPAPSTFPSFVYTAEINVKGFIPKTCGGGFSALTGYPAENFLRPNFYEDHVVSIEDVERLRRFHMLPPPPTGVSMLEYNIVDSKRDKVRVREYTSLVTRRDGEAVTSGLVVISREGVEMNSAASSDATQIEELKKLNDRLIEANQLKDEFLANTSHELRTPLNSIIGFLTLITEGYYDSPAELGLFAHNALESSYHLLSVINDLLDISRIESGKMNFQIERIYVKELLNDVCTSFETQATQKKLKLEYGIGSPPLFASADLRRLKQVLINLVGNAIKFTSNGEVKILADRVDGKVRFTVQDTGIGIAKTEQSKLFQKFVQVEGSTTRRYGGTGLGLAISKHLIEMMGGDIKIESAGLHKGTTASFTVPGWTEDDE